MIDRTPAPRQLIRYAATHFPLEARCADCGAVIPARALAYRRIDRREGYPVVCREEHG